MARTLVITLGQLRGGNLTWGPFKKYVLDELQADLAVCVPNDKFFDFKNPFFQNATYKWVAPDFEDYADAFDDVSSLLKLEKNWRKICQIPGSWLGRIKDSNNSGAASILFFLRWWMLQNIKSGKLLDKYERFIITRSDYYFLSPHPSMDILNSEYIWMPNGEDYGGFTDRHIVVKSQDLILTCAMIENLLEHPDAVYERFSRATFVGIEDYIRYHFELNDLTTRVKRFPFVMFLVRSEGDPSAWAQGGFSEEVGMVIKYPLEVMSARILESQIKTKKDWEYYFIIQTIIESMGNSDWSEMYRSTDFSKIFERRNALENISYIISTYKLNKKFNEEDKFVMFALSLLNKSYSQLFQDLWIINETDGHKGYFVDIGAGDGIIWSNTALLEKQYGWRGIVSEANKNYHTDLERNRNAYVSFDCVCNRDEDIVDFFVAKDPIYSTMVDYLDKIDPSKKNEGKNIKVKTININKLLEDAEAPRQIDFLSIDTSGSELEIISSINFDKYDIKYICINDNYSDYSILIQELLYSHGFKRVYHRTSKWDGWYVKKN